MTPTELATVLVERLTGVPADRWPAGADGDHFRETRDAYAADADLMTDARADLDATLAALVASAIQQVRAAADLACTGRKVA